MRRLLVIGAVAGVAITIVVIMFFSFGMFQELSSKPKLQTYDPAKINANLTDSELLAKAKEEPTMKLFLEHYPNAKIDIRHSNDMRHNPPFHSVRFEEERYLETDPENTVRIFTASVVFPLANNSTGFSDLDCVRAGIYSAEHVVFVPVDNATDSIINEKCFYPIPPGNRIP